MNRIRTYVIQIVGNADLRSLQREIVTEDCQFCFLRESCRMIRLRYIAFVHYALR